MKFISVIPARSGSKGIKNKNIIKIGKKPLVQYTFEAAINSKINENFILSDNAKIKNLAKKFKINTQDIRPKKFSGSTTSLSETLNHFNTWLKQTNINYYYMVILQPTYPLSDSKDITNFITII